MPPLLPVAPAPTWPRSSTTTRPAPCRARWNAALRPLMPAPTTTTSAVSGMRHRDAGGLRQDLVHRLRQQVEAGAQRLVGDVQRRQQLQHLVADAPPLAHQAAPA